VSDLTCLQEWNRWAEEGKTVIETLTELNNRYRKVDDELNALKAEHLKLHQSLAKAQLAAVPLCIGRPIIDILAKEGQWISETGQGVVAADDLFRNSPYDALDEANAKVAELESMRENWRMSSVCRKLDAERIAALQLARELRDVLEAAMPFIGATDAPEWACGDAYVVIQKANQQLCMKES
jgi:hypothetical protein